MITEFVLETIHIYNSKLRNGSCGTQSWKTTNNWNLADPAAEKVKQKKNATLMLKSYHENQQEQNENYVQLNWLEVV